MEYNVSYISVPGMCPLYEGTKHVAAKTEDDAVDEVYKLLHKAFPDRSRNGWIFNAEKENQKINRNKIKKNV